ncbi:unnamed protein product [Heterobilharzia americana]|nr:unnamed protein product [Heterobilharzia americana]
MARSRAPSSCFGAKKQRLDEETTSRSCVPRNGLNTPGVVRREMCYFCFDVLHSHLHNTDPPSAPKTFPNSSYPLFVTWTYGKDDKLRGCIGTFTAMNIHNGLREYAINRYSTFLSTFRTIQCYEGQSFLTNNEEEFPHLTCSVSLLLHFEEGKNYQDWQIGVHGIRIEFVNEKGYHRTATYCRKLRTNKVGTIVKPSIRFFEKVVTVAL